MRPYLHPPPIQRRSFLVESQIARQPNPTQFILVLSRSVDHIRLMKHHIPRLVVAHHPPQLPAPSHPPKLLGVMRQESVLHHTPVKRIDTLFRTQPLRIECEFGLQLLAEQVAVLKVHQPAARRRTVADRHPRREELGLAPPQEILVVVDARAQAPRAVVPQHGPVYEHFFAPGRQVSHEAAEGGMREEFAVGARGVDRVE